MVEIITFKEKHHRALKEHLIKHRINIAGLSLPSNYDFFLKDAITGKNVCIVIAELNNNIAGWSIAIIDSRNYWKKYLLRHFFLGIAVFISRLNMNPLASNNEVNEGSSSKINNLGWDRCKHKWGESSPNVARHINITVLDTYKRKGIGSKLYQKHIKELQKRGVDWFDAYISADNTHSINFHKKLGWKLIEIKHNMIYISLQLK